jgi:hypothetical protein
LFGIAVAAALCAQAPSWFLWRGFTLLDAAGARAVVGGACKNPVGALYCGMATPPPGQTTVCVSQKGKMPGNQEGDVNEDQTTCYAADMPPRSDWDLMNCLHTHKKCLSNGEF